MARKEPLRKLGMLDRVAVSRIAIVSMLQRKPLRDIASEIRPSHGTQRLVEEASEIETDVLTPSSWR